MRIRLSVLGIVLLSIVWVASLSFAGIAVAEIAVIVNQENSVSDLSSKDLKNIYKLKKTTWSTGEKIEAVNLTKEDQIREEFSEAILRKNSDAMEKYYLRQALSGKGQPPRVMESSSALKEFVRYNKNAIGYIDAKDVDGSVKVISIDGKKQL